MKISRERKDKVADFTEIGNTKDGKFYFKIEA